MQVMQAKDKTNPLSTFKNENTLLQRMRAKKWMKPNQQINIIGGKH